MPAVAVTFYILLVKVLERPSVAGEGKEHVFHVCRRGTEGGHLLDTVPSPQPLPCAPGALPLAQAVEGVFLCLPASCSPVCQPYLLLFISKSVMTQATSLPVRAQQ